MKNLFEYILFLGFSYCFRILGLNISRRLSYPITVIVFYIIPIRKKTVFENLTRAFPGYTSKKIRNIAFESYRSFIIALIEILYLPSMSEAEMKKVVHCINYALITERFNEGNGVILLSAHFGNWEYVALSVSLQSGIPFHVVVKPQRNPFVTKWMNIMRTRWINKVIPLGISIREIYKQLKEKNIVAMAADQRGPYEGIRVNLFGMKTAVYSGPAILSLKTVAPMICGITIREPDYSYTVNLIEIDRENLPENEDEKIIELSQRYTSYIESIIRKHPEQWLWMHKRWKY